MPAARTQPFSAVSTPHRSRVRGKPKESPRPSARSRSSRQTARPRPINGPLSHLDLSVGDPDRSIPFYAALLEAIGFTRFPSAEPGWTGDKPQRAAWFIRYADGAFFGIDLRPAEEGKHDRPYDRYAPGPHHVAFHAESREAVDRVHEEVLDAGGVVLDAPAEYKGPAYGGGYYAVFPADPDGVKLEVVHHPPTNP